MLSTEVGCLPEMSAALLITNSRGHLLHGKRGELFDTDIKARRPQQLVFRAR